MRKTTMKDIAKAANVSVATVSYVLNNVAGQSIPESTRTQIQQIAKELHYIPNLAARSLIKQETGLVGILVNRDPHEDEEPYWKRYAQHHFIDRLERRLTASGRHTLLVSLDASRPSLDVIVERKLDAVFVIDVREDRFYEISTRFAEGVPLILIDSLIEDPLFNQVIYDYESAIRQAREAMDADAETCLILERHHNQALTRQICQASGIEDERILIAENSTGLERQLRRAPCKNAIVVNEFLGQCVEQSRAFERLAVVCTCGCPEMASPRTKKVVFQEDKSQVAFELMEKLRRNPYEALPTNRILTR